MDVILNYNQVSNLYNHADERSKKSEIREDTKLVEDRLIKEMQEEEFLRAKSMDEELKKKELEDEKKLIEEEKRKKLEIEQKKREYEEKMERKKASLPPEPNENEEGVAEIAFRLSTGKRIIRRFPKTCTIQVLIITI